MTRNLEDLTFPLAYEWTRRNAARTIVTVVFLCPHTRITHGFEGRGWGAMISGVSVCPPPWLPLLTWEWRDFDAWDGPVARRISLEEASAR